MEEIVKVATIGVVHLNKPMHAMSLLTIKKRLQLTTRIAPVATTLFPICTRLRGWRRESISHHALVDVHEVKAEGCV